MACWEAHSRDRDRATAVREPQDLLRIQHRRLDPHVQRRGKPCVNCKPFYLETMKMEIRRFEQGDSAAVVQLWSDCGLVVPWNDPHKDIQRKLTVQPEMFLVGCTDDQIIASVMAGYDGHRGWINYLAVHPAHQRSGVGRRMMEEAENRLRAAGCPKINLQVRGGNAAVIAFYNEIGFKMDDVVSLGKRLEPDD
jgi:ribosomal protein S18 acetylase RimI-like enzyme